MPRTRLVRHQLLLSHSLLALGIFVILSAFFMRYTYQLLQSRANENMESQLESIVGQVELEVERMDTVLLNILYSDVVKENYHAIGMDVEKSRQIMDAMITINGPSLEVQQINAYTFDGKVVSAVYANREIQGGYIHNRSWYQPVVNLEGKRYISVPAEDDSKQISSSLGLHRYISISRLLFSKYDKPIGIVEVERDVRNIFSSAKRLLDNSESFASLYVFNNHGTTVYSNVNETYPYVVEFDNDFINIKDGGAWRTTVKDSHRISVRSSESSGWAFVMATPKTVIYRPVKMLFVMMGCASVAVIAVVMLFSNALAARISRPLNQLSAIVTKTTIDNIGEGKWQIDKGMVEISELASKFQQMQAYLSRSINQTIQANEQEAQARMLALQSQMNPHFLYNTLNNISVMAEKNMNPEITEMCHNVTFMLRYISSASNQVVTIACEIDYAKKYLECMKLRYGKYLSYEIDIQDGTESIEILKLMVQPLVENALRYGVGSDSTWKIFVRSQLEPDGGWTVSVRSDGECFDPDKLHELQQKMLELDKHGSYAPLSIKGMGLLNLYCRLRLLLGERSVFRIDNDENKKSAKVIFGAVGNGGEMNE